MTRIKESLNLFYHGIKASERAEMFADVRSWLAEMDDSQPTEDERVVGIQARYNSWRPFKCVPENADVFERAVERAHKDIGILLSLLPVQPARCGCEGSCPVCRVGDVDNHLCRSCGSQFCPKCHGLLYTESENVGQCSCNPPVQPAASTPTDDVEREKLVQRLRERERGMFVMSQEMALSPKARADCAEDEKMFAKAVLLLAAAITPTESITTAISSCRVNEDEAADNIELEAYNKAVDDCLAAVIDAIKSQDARSLEQMIPQIETLRHYAAASKEAQDDE